MISRLEIRNFKSIRHLALDCRRVNVFIGEPNTGKSNILESLGVFSALLTGNIQDFVRMEEMTDLFHKGNLNEEVAIRAGPYSFFCQFDEYTGMTWGRLEVFSEIIPASSEPLLSLRFTKPQLEMREPYQVRIRFYRFSPLTRFQRSPIPFLLPPDGKNLPYLLRINKELRQLLGEIFASYGLQLEVEYRGDWLKIQYEKGEGITFPLPYPSASETLRRIAFYLAAIKTNRDAVLIFEEPEAHAFPLYTKYLTERIALDRSNQYFLTTHDPFSLISLVEKTPAEEIAVFVVYVQDGQIQARLLTDEALEVVLDLDADVFFNLDVFLDSLDIPSGA
ncbi:MAG: AAA family ATPase [Anaerolineae bacterium]|nr:AAA family ATPase [Anaerolineae bacterium]